MRIGEHIFFAPGVRFSDLDLDGPHLTDQYRTRMEGYYLRPADRCVAAGHGFAAGLLAVVAIDAMSRLYFGPNRGRRFVNRDFRTFTCRLLPSFSSQEYADILYEKYRNGLVHEGRLKDGCQFELNRSMTLDNSGPVPVIDPARLLQEVREALNRLVDDISASEPFRREFARLLKNEFTYELTGRI